MEQRRVINKKVLVWNIIAIVIAVLGLITAAIVRKNSLGESSQDYSSEHTAVVSQAEIEETALGTVITKYVDTEGEQLEEPETQTGEVGSQYTTTRKPIDHYISNGFEPLNKIGDFSEGEITVTYVYQLISDSIDVVREGDVITVKVENILKSGEYTLRLEQESVDGVKLTGGQFSATVFGNNTDKVEGTTINGNLTIGAVTVSDEVDDELILVEQKAPEGYERALEDGGVRVFLYKSYNEELKKYELRAESETLDIEVEEDHENREIILKVKNDIIKTYDLAIKQYASSIDGEDTGRSITASVNTTGEIEYAEVEKTLEVRDGEKVVYTIRVYNEGNQDMSGQTITYTLPKGLKYIEESQINKENGWNLTEGVLATDKIVDETIEGIDTSKETTVKYKEIKIEVEVIEEEATEGDELTSIASIPLGENEENEENNTCEETVTLARMPAIYDVAIKKFASEINGIETGRGVTATLNNLKQIVYEEENPEAKIKHGQKIVYTIRVYNEGNKAVKGTKITDTIPEGYKFDATSTINSQYGWTQKGDKIETDYLTTQEEIEGCKPYRGELPNSVDLKIEFTLDEDEVAEGEISLVNEVTIEKVENETDDLDNTDDDEVTLERAEKTYDLAVKVFATEIDEEETSRNVTVAVENGEIKYTENRPEKSVKDEQRVIYTIRVYNEGTGAVKGTKITDIIPAGLVYVPDSATNLTYGWRLNGNNVVETDYLTTQDEIEGVNLRKDKTVSYKELKVEFEVVEDETAESVDTIINIVRAAKAEGETDEADNEDSDTLNLTRRDKIYDLSIKKFASKVDEENTGRSIEVSVTEQNEIEYTEVRPEVTVKEGQKVIYTIRVYNEGNQAAVAEKITENIPAGLKYLPESEINTENGWQEVDGKIETTILASEIINRVIPQKGEIPSYKEVFVEFEVTRDGLDEQPHTITNTAEVDELEGEVDLTDNTAQDSIKLAKKSIYDLAVKIFANKINNDDTGRNVTVSVNEDNEIEYIKTDVEKTVKDEDRVIYTIRVYNEGNETIKGTKVTDVIPAGLVYVPDSTTNLTYGWKLKENNIVETDYLTTQDEIPGITIRSGEIPSYKELKVEFEVVEDETEENVTTITNVVRIAKAEGETDEADNEDTDTVNLERKEKTYDLSIKKFASKIDGENTGRSVEVSLTEGNEIKYTEVRPEKIVKEGQKVIYTIRVYNEGNQDVVAGKITESIPVGLKYLPESEINTENGWELVDGKLETTILSGETIKGVDTSKGEVPNYKEIFVEFEVIRAWENKKSHTITNSVEIEKLEKETDTEDNKAEDTVTLEGIPTYDLGVKKFASKIDGEDTGRNVTVSVNENGEVVYTKTDVEKTVQDGQIVEYTIRVFNEGDIEIEGTKITEDIPAGLKYLPEHTTNIENEWQEADGKVTTDKLVGEIIPVYSKDQNDVVNYKDVKIVFEVVEDEAPETDLITNIVRADKNENEEDTQNNEDTDTVNLKRKEKTYDLSIRKFASKIDGEDTGRSVEVLLTEENEIQYTEVRPEKTVKAGQKVIYTIRVYNEGNQDVVAGKITESIPAGLKYLPESEINTENGWELVDGKLETTILSGETIKGVDTSKGEVPNHKDIFVEFEVVRDWADKKSHTITNSVEIEKLEKETDTEDNKSEDTVTLEGIPTYDLGVKKFASKIDGEDTGRNVTVSVNENGEIEYTKIDVAKTVTDGQIVEYTIRVFNEGDIEIEGTKITEEIPAGLRYLPESSLNIENGWQEADGKVTTDKLVGEIIPVYGKDQVNYKDVKIEFEVVEEEAPETDLITNIVRADKNENEEEEDTQNNEDTDTVDLLRKIKTHDITMKKFVYSVDGVKQDKEITAKVNSNGNLIYENDNTKTTVSKEQIVVFTLRIFNVGNQPMVGKTVTDTIPEGLTYIEESEINKKYNWSVVDGIATTDYLVGQVIEGFEKEEGQSPKYVDVQIEFKVTGENVKAEEEIINKAKMEPAENEDNPDDNEDESILVLEPEKVRVSDLSMKKFLYSVDGEKLPEREVVAKNINGEITYTKNKEIYKVSNNQKLVYTLRVYNVGDGETTGRSVTEYIPDGLQLVKDSEINKENGWVMYKEGKNGILEEVEDISKATVVKTDKLESETIAGFEAQNNELPKYKDVQIELVVVEDNVKTQDRIVTNIAKVEESRLEPDPTNDDDTEQVYVKEFDLNVTKYIKEIKIQDDTGTKTTTVGIENKGKIIKKEIDKKKVNQTVVYVTYGLKVKNIGEIEGYATEITDYVPEDLVLESADGIWEKKGNTITTNTLANKLIKPGESRTIEVTFKWKLNENNLGARTNTAITSASKNDYDAKDKTPDKDNNETFIISLRTGAELTQTILGVITMILICVAIAISIKLRKESKK